MGKKRIKTKDEPEVSDGAKKAPEEQAAPRARHMGSRGVAHVQATYNNTLINISDERGNVVAWSSSGSIGFRGSKKSTPFAAARVAEVVAEKAKKIGKYDLEKLSNPEELALIKKLLDFPEEIEKSGFTNSVPSGLVITGGGAITVGMIELGRKSMGMPIRIGSPSGITGLVDELLNPQYATTVGLLLYGQKNIITEAGWKNFNRILRDINLGNSVSKIKEFFKQFIP